MYFFIILYFSLVLHMASWKTFYVETLATEINFKILPFFQSSTRIYYKMRHLDITASLKYSRFQLKNLHDVINSKKIIKKSIIMQKLWESCIGMWSLYFTGELSVQLWSRICFMDEQARPHRTQQSNDLFEREGIRTY